MEFSENLRIGDKVVFKVDRDRRAWTDTYKDIPDGTVGVVCGFYDAVRTYGRESAYIKKPGVYWSKGAASVRLDDGRIITGCGNEIDLVDKDEQKRRDAQNRDARNCFIHEEIFLGELPPTPFWEGDTVERTRYGETETLIVVSIDYDKLHDDKMPYVYTLRHPEQSHRSTGADVSELKLIERGNIWKEEHGEKLYFSSLQEHAAFEKSRGRAKEVRNPRTDIYKWTLEEALAAVEAGDAHEVTIESGQRVSVYRFDDHRLGRRVAELTLASIAEKVG